MADLDTRFRRLDRVRGPDLWDDIETRQPRTMPADGAGRRATVAVVALALAVGGAVLVTRAFFPEDRPAERRVRPAQTPLAPVEPVIDVTLPIKWPSSIVYGEGSIWIAASANDGTGAGTVYRIDPDTAEILTEIDVPTIPGWEFGGSGMEVGGGSLWIAGYHDQGSQGALVRIDTATNRLADVVPLGGEFAGDVAVDERGIWVTLFSEPSVELARIDPQVMAVDLRASLRVDWAREVISVDGHVWIEVVKNRLLRIDPETGDVVQEVHVPGGGGWSLTTSDGSIWSYAWTKDEGNALVRIDPMTGATQSFPAGPLEGLIDAGSSGLWGRSPGSTDGAPGVGIVRFDPSTGTTDVSVDLPDRKNPIDLAVAPGSVWVIFYDGGVTRVELRPA